MSERLEELKNRVWKDACAYAESDEQSREGFSYTLSDYDYEWIIQQAEAANKWSKQLVELNQFLQGRANGICAGHQVIYVAIELIKQLERRVEELEEHKKLALELEKAYQLTKDLNQRYKQALELIHKDTFYESEHDLISPIHVIRKRVEKVLGESE